MSQQKNTKPKTSNRFRPACQPLESRALPSSGFRSIDGSGNNIAHPDWGSAGSTLLRVGPAAYGDGISSPAGATRPSPRAISNAVAGDDVVQDEASNRGLSAWVYAFGQFIDHDLSLTQPGSPRDRFPIPVPIGDPEFDPAGTGTRTIGLSRSEFDPATGTGAGNPRQQFNELTAYLDGSVVYGSDATRAAALRTFSGGRLKTSAGNLLPFNADGLPNQNDGPTPNDQLFLAGDIRANENIELTAVQTLFVREHNRLAAEIAAANPGLGDEEVYQRARRIVGAELQAITYNEWLPALLGANALRPYAGYDPTVNPGIANEFSTAALRIGHTLLANDVQFLDNSAGRIREGLDLSQAFSNPGVVVREGADPILKYLATDAAREVDNVIVSGVRNFLFGPPGAGGFDLASLNIQRGRDHGLADYNSLRAAYGLPRVTDFAGITSNPQLQGKLQALYGRVDNIDPWVGGLAEDHAAGSSVGPLFRTIIAEQFERVRDGDRFWYQRELTGAELAEVEGTTLADLIRRNSTVTNLQENVFVFNPAVTGTAFHDRNGNGVRDANERPLAGLTVRLEGEEGAVGEATTGADGTFMIDGFAEPGSYRVVLAARPGWTVTSGADAEVGVTRGGEFGGYAFGTRNSEVFAVGAGAGGVPMVKVYDAQTGLPKSEVMAYDPSFRGGVRVATGDLNGDGVPEVVTGAGAGGGPHVRAFDGVTGAVVLDFFAFEDEFRGGVVVTVGDVDGDGIDDVAVGAGAGGGPRVRVFSGKDSSILADFFAFPADFTGGVSLTLGNFDADPALELAVGAGAGGGAVVRTFDVVGGQAVPLGRVAAFEPEFRGGIWLAAGDTDGDGVDELIVGAGDGGGPRVRVLSRYGAVLADYFAADPGDRGGVRVATVDSDADGRAEVVAGAGTRLHVYAGPSADDVFPDELALGHGSFVGGRG
ncbi:MAG: carboxypeptidase regulatory-like domain-containing protein [Gemmataceae bacterium]|nr:carboxypeptidase regulatory-like domain-containing protein [Gemmataceae bacterium]